MVILQHLTIDLQIRNIDFTSMYRASVFLDAFPAVFFGIAFVCLSFPSQNKNFNFPAA